MTWCFAKSRIMMGSGCTVTLVIAIAIVVTRKTQPLWLTLVTVLLLLLLGVMFSCLLANMVAAREHQKLLTVLYAELDPSRFLKQYVCIPMKSNADTVTGMMSTVYLTDGLCAAGRYDEALELLNRCTIPANAPAVLALECLLCNSKCHCLLQKGDADIAEAAMRQYAQVLECAKYENAKLAENLAEQYAAFQQELFYLQGNPVDMKVVQTAAAHSPVLLRKLELIMLQAKVYAQNKNIEQRNTCCDIVLKTGDKLAFSRQAQTLKD